MQNPPNNPWIHIGECPVCVNGLCRVRACHGPCNLGSDQDDPAASLHLYAICDECEATWTEPSTSTPKTFPDSDDARCPICAEKLYGEQSHWALPQDLLGTAWESQVIFDVASSEPRSDDSQG